VNSNDFDVLLNFGQNGAIDRSYFEKLAPMKNDPRADECDQRRIVSALKLENPVVILRSGAGLIAYLEGEENREHPTPAMIFLDLRMDDMDGFESLQWLKARPEYASIPVVALTGVEDPKYVRRAYQSGATTFLRKPIPAADLRILIHSFEIPVTFP